MGAIARLACDGNAGAERTLLRAVGPAILQAVRGVLGAHHPEVPDLCQEASLALLQALPRFRGECTVTHFACRIAVLSAMNARRRARSQGGAAPTLDPDEISDPGGSPQSLLSAAQRRQALRALLEELPSAQAEVLAHHVMLGQTIEETAEAMSAPVNTIRSRLRYALGALRQRVSGDPSLFELIRGGHE